MQTQDTMEIDSEADSALALLDGPTDADLTQAVQTNHIIDRPVPRSLEEIHADGVIPDAPTEAKPGTEAKVRMLSARYEAGLPLWNDEDRLDHGPDERGGINLLSLAPVAADDVSDSDEQEEGKENEDKLEV
jgi:hypothetical protein